MPKQSFKVKLPSEGQVFRQGDNVFIRKGNDAQLFDLENLLVKRRPELFERREGTFAPRIGVDPLSEQQKLFKKLTGKDIKSLQSFDSESLGQAFKQLNPQSRFSRQKGEGGNIIERITDVNVLTGGLNKKSTGGFEVQTGASALPQKKEEGAVDTTTTIPQFNFTQQLQFGDNNEEVKELQKFLNSVGFEVGKEGTAGSAGNETTFFGPKTQKALQDYQKSQGIVSTGTSESTGFGRFGPKTIKSVNKLATKDIAPTDTTTSPTQPTGDVADNITPEVSQTIKDTKTEEDTSLEELLGGSTLSDDQKEIVKSIFSATSSFDQDMLERLESSFDAAEKLGEPFFNAQIRIARDELQRGFQKIEDDLDFSEKSLNKNLTRLREDISKSKGTLSLDEQQQLGQLERALSTKLDSTRQNLATAGFTESSRRAKSEELINTTAGELRESTKRSFGVRQEDLSTKLARSETDVEKEIERLKELTKKGKLELGRKGESVLGSERAKGLGFDVLGGIPGSIEASRQKDIQSFGRSFVF